MYNRRFNQKYNIPETPLNNRRIVANMGENLSGIVGDRPVFVSGAKRWRYNTQPYNRVPDTSRHNIVAHMSESLRGWMSIGAEYHITARMSERLTGYTRAAKGYRLRIALSEKMNGSVRVFPGIRVGGHLLEELTGKLHAGADIHIRRALEETLGGAALMGADIHLTRHLEEALSGAVHAGADIHVARMLYETLNGYVSGGNVSEYVTTIRDPIPAGSVLIIDSDNYNVLLDGQDAIALHSGDWPSVDRPTAWLTLSSLGATNFTWEVFFTERYL